MNRTIKLFIGGALKRSANDSYRTVHSSTGAVLGSLPDATKKDVRDAVEAAAKAFPGYVLVLNLANESNSEHGM